MQPDFIIIGAMKCGTSTLAAQLAAQPGLFMTSPKEPNYFSDDEVFANGPEWYAALFAGAGAGDLTGEASTHYTKLPTHPHTIERLAATGARPRLVYMIRDPVDRAVSHYIHEWTMGNMSGSFDEALKTHPELIDYGRYGFQIAPWVERFGAESICIVGIEEMKRDPQVVLVRVCRHLGFSGNPAWQENLKQVNASAERIRRLPMHDLLIESPVAKALRRTLVPKSMRDRIRRSRQMELRPEVSTATRDRLQDVFAEDHAVLIRLFPDGLAGSYPFLPA